MFKTVIFDLDGTLLNTLEDLGNSANILCEKKGWPTHTMEEYKYFVGNGMPKLVERFSPEDKRDEKTFNETLKEYMEIYAVHKEDTTRAYPGIAELLKELKAAGIKIGVFSNKDHIPTQAVVEHYLPGLADKIRGRIDGIAPKPDPTGLFAIMKELDAKPEETLFVGDSNVDMETAKNGRLTSCGVLWGFRTKEELIKAGANNIAANTQEVKKIVLG